MGAKQTKGCSVPGSTGSGSSGGGSPQGPLSASRRRILPSRERGNFLASLVVRSGEKFGKRAGGSGLPPYHRRIVLIQDMLRMVKQGRHDEATDMLKHLRQDLGMESTSLDDVLYRYASFRNLVDPITHDLIISLARYIHCPKPEGDSVGAMEKLCRQLTYHLSPHSQWRRQGMVKRKPQAWAFCKMAAMKLRVAVIGAGAAGLCAARHILASPETFAPPVVFEASDRLGGTWIYTEEKEDTMGRAIHSSMYRDLRTNLPKESMAFPDFPFDPSLPSFLHHSDVLAYLDSYAEQSGVWDHIRFQWQVEEVWPIQRDTGSLGGWQVTATTQHPKSTKQVTEHFDAVMVCTGHYTVPFIPPIPGLDTFQGHLLHSHSYRYPEPFANQSVVLVGSGPSGVDLALQLSDVAAQVVLSHKRQHVCGLPKNVIQVPPILKVGQKTMEFTDGSKMSADVLILCTGYKYSFPFLDLAQLGLQETDYGMGPLYQHLLPPRHPSIFLIGLCQQICPFPHFHCQVLFALAMLSGRYSLPSVADMEAEVQRQLGEHLKNGGLSQYFLKLREQQWSYMENLAHLAGFPPVPPAVQQIYEDTHASRLYNVSTYRSRNYRLLGPSAWELVQDCGGNCINPGDAE